MKNGILVELGNEEELADRIEYLMLNNDGRRNLAENMFENIKKISPENYGNKLKEILQNIK